jgi:clan AA aspartic protease
MIAGTVNHDEARISLRLLGPDAREQTISAVIDTGYTASVTLPPTTITALGLRWQGLGRGKLADGSVCLFDVYEAEVVWDGQTRRVLVDEADTESLVGMALLHGYELKMEIRADGMVEITALSD